MDKNISRTIFFAGKLKHLSLITRIAVMFFFTCVFCVAGENSYAQRAKVTINKNNATIREILDEIESQTDYLFLYDHEIGTSDKRSIHAVQKTVEEVLNTILDDKNIDYSMIGSHIILSNKEKEEQNGKKDELQPKQDKKQIKGIVVDEKGEPISFVNVVIKGSTIGTVTDDDGHFEIATDKEVTLIFSLIGFKDYEVSTDGKTFLKIVMIEDSKLLDEVVVTGYNEVERKHIASSIATVDMDKIKTRPLFKLQEGFSGTIPGLTVNQTDNLPGNVASFSIRGISTLQGAQPLVIVDGMEQSLTDIDPNQIKSIHILKDAASASMYGSRGANGVIIIETERGKTGKFKVNLHTWMAVQNPIDLPRFVNSADFMRLRNEAHEIQSQPLLYTEEDIKKAEDGLTPNTNWLNEIIQRPSHSYNFSSSISGGGGVGTFNLMLGYIKQMGLNDKEGTNKFSARFNTNINIADKFILLADFYAHRLQVDRLYMNDDGHGLYQIAWRMDPTQGIFYYDTEIPDHYILHNNMNPLASIEKGGIKNYLHDRVTLNIRPKYYITDKFNLEGNISYLLNKSADKSKRQTYKFYDAEGKPLDVWKNVVEANQGVSVSQITARGLLNYHNKIRNKKDDFYAVVGSEVMNYVYTDYREIAKASFFGKLNYSFDNRYLFEATVRSDGSSKFAPGHQWGFFPSASIGWNIHNERFMKKLNQNKLFNELKLRLSYGKIGNENVSPYLWQEIVNYWGWTMRVPNPNFTWEKQKQWNLGLDVKTLNNRLSLTAEIYNKYSYDLIYSDFPVPPLTGSYYLTSSINIGEVENKGWEISAKFQDEIGDFSYSVKGILFDNVNKVLKAGHTVNDTLVFKNNTDKIWYRGIPIDNFYGYKTQGYFQTKEEIEATQAKFPNTLPGDIKYVDQNGDGIINEKDRVFLGDPFPHMNYSIAVDLIYKKWDFSILGQGVGKRLGRLGGQEGYPVLMDGATNSLGAPRQEYMDNRWTPETPNSRFPRVWTGASTNTELSDVWLSNAAYFRIKTIQLGYSFSKIGNLFRNARIYLTAQDAFTFTKWEGLEPERNYGGSGNYPRMATYNIGFQATLF